MGISKRHSTACSRSREWICQQLDTELSELERALLHAHLDGCAECQAFETDTVALTAALRSAPLELLPYPVELPLRHRASRLLVGTAAASAAAAVVGVGTLLSVLSAGHSPSRFAIQPQSGIVVATADDAAVLRASRLQTLVPSTRAPLSAVVQRGLHGITATV